MLHLGLASAALAQPALLRGSSFGNDFWADDPARAAGTSMEKILAGIRKYQMHPYQRPVRHHSVVWSDGEARLVWYAGKTTARRKVPRAQILLVPSLINGSEILDILPDDLSLVAYLVQQGYDVFLLQWGYLRNDPDLFDLESVIAEKLARMVAWLSRERSDVPLVALGYCMGGLLLTALATRHPEAFDALVFVATPWDFSVGGTKTVPQAIRDWASSGGLARVAHLDYMPSEWLQLIFAGVDPSLIARKFSAFADMPEGSHREKLFVAVEDWINGGADLPAGVVMQSVTEWYIRNATMKNDWRIGGEVVDPKKISKPALVVVPAKDRIVPPVSAKALARRIPDADILETECGHISMMVGSSARDDVWKPMTDWIEENVSRSRIQA